MDGKSIGLCPHGVESLRCRAWKSNAVLMSSDAPAFRGTAAHGPAALSVEKQRHRIVASAGNQQHRLENPSGPHLAPPPQKANFAKCLFKFTSGAAGVYEFAIVGLLDRFISHDQSFYISRPTVLYPTTNRLISHDQRFYTPRPTVLYPTTNGFISHDHPFYPLWEAIPAQSFD